MFLRRITLSIVLSTTLIPLSVSAKTGVPTRCLQALGAILGYIPPFSYLEDSMSRADEAAKRYHLARQNGDQRSMGKHFKVWIENMWSYDEPIAIALDLGDDEGTLVPATFFSSDWKPNGTKVRLRDGTKLTVSNGNIVPTTFRTDEYSQTRLLSN